MWVCVRVCARVRRCMRVSVRVCGLGFAFLSASIFASFCDFSVQRVSAWHACVRAPHACVRVPRGCVSPPIARAGTGGINSSVRGASAAARASLFVLGAHRRGRRAWAAGITWTQRTRHAEWGNAFLGGRYGHTSVIDAAGAIYVIGGYFYGFTFYQDVWASTDGGADRTA
jgi:hypothetical protein